MKGTEARPGGYEGRKGNDMKTVNDFLNADCFVIKDTKLNEHRETFGFNVLGLQINVFGEHDLSDKYGDRPVLGHRMESEDEIWGGMCLGDGTKTLVLYI